MAEPGQIPSEQPNTSDTPSCLPEAADADSLPEIDDGGMGMGGGHRDGFVSVSFTSVPQVPYDRFKDVARERGMLLRDLFGAALRLLLADRKAGTVMYHASRKGGIRRAMWLEEDLVEEVRATADRDQVSQTTFFLTALRRYAEKEGLDIEV